MKFTHLLIMVALATVCCHAWEARAAVFERDWKAPGDGLLTYDDVSQREWLDLSQTLLSNQFPGSTRDERYDYVVQQTLPGGVFSGFSVARSADVVLLAESAGIDTTTMDKAINAAPTLALGGLLSYTLDSIITGAKFSAGLLDEIAMPPDDGRLGAMLGVSPTTNQAGLRFAGISDLLFNPPPGVMLYRAIPEPSSCLLAMICLLARGGVR